MATLVIRHEAGGEGYRFSVQRVSATGVKSAPSVVLADPLRRVLGDTQLTLEEELAWYLEQYLDYPFGPNEQRAERVTGALRNWGTEAYNTLFGSGQARDFYGRATDDGHAELHIVVASDDAGVLAWPWEALHDPMIGDLAHLCRIERQLDHLSDPLPLPENLSRERIGILLVTARPYGDDVSYRNISRPLVELIRQRGLPAEVAILRPPTFRQLREELRSKPGAYHIVHFDGHGAFTEAPVGAPSTLVFGGPKGHLVFEEEDGSADPVTAGQLSQLLREHRIPIAVLNACQSGMQSAEAEDAFASVATALLRAGVRSVVAMGYSLYVSAAREFLPAFYERLFDSGNIAEATRAGRQALFERPERLSARGPYPLQDWLVPVLYQQEPLTLEFDRHAQAAVPNRASLPEEAQINPQDAPYGLIGRDRAILALERAMRRPPAGLLVHGLGGVGKTTLARGFVEWLAQTDGLSGGVLWLSFVDVRSAEYVINRLVEELFGTDAMAAPDPQKLPALVQALRENAYLIVWDNFESASGAADAGLESPMPAEDRQQLKELLEQLRGGRTKVLITSRSDEAWLGPTSSFRVPLRGLQGEERWALADAVLRDLGIRADRNDPVLADLLNNLEGHPLMMRAILPKLGGQTGEGVRDALERYVPEADSADPVEQKLYATLRFVEDGLPERLKPLLYPLSLYEGCVDADALAAMAEGAEQAFDLAAVGQCLQMLEAAGLTQGIGNNVFSLHPALTSYLRSQVDRFSTDGAVALAWQRAFVVAIAQVAEAITLRPLGEQRQFFGRYGGCVLRASQLAEKIGMATPYNSALILSLGRYARERNDLAMARRYFEALARHCETHEPQENRIIAYNELAAVAYRMHDFAAAEASLSKALTNKKKGGYGYEAGAYHQLGVLAQTQHKFAAAEALYRKALAILKRRGDTAKMVNVYHQLGTVEFEQHNFEAAEVWFRKSLKITESLGDEAAAAHTYTYFAMIAEKRGDHATADVWYLKSLEIMERVGDEAAAARAHRRLGLAAQLRGDFAAAEAWYGKSLAITERLKDTLDSAHTYHTLGALAYMRHDFDAAEAWYRKSLMITERLGDEVVAAKTCRGLGLLSEARGELVKAAEWRLRERAIFVANKDMQSAESVDRGIVRVHAKASPDQQACIEALWARAGFGMFPKK